MAAAAVALVIAPLLVLLGAIYLVSARNTFARQTEALARQWAHIDGELRRRHDMVQALLDVATTPVPEIVGTEMVHRLVSALQLATPQSEGPAERGRAEQTLDGALSTFLELAGNYPQLRAYEPFQQLSGHLVECQHGLFIDIRTYNVNVKAYNSRFDRLPSRLMQDGFGKAHTFEVNVRQLRPCRDHANHAGL